jgi:hypothetical protein
MEDARDGKMAKNAGIPDLFLQGYRILRSTLE